MAVLIITHIVSIERNVLGDIAVMLVRIGENVSHYGKSHNLLRRHSNER